MSQQTCITKHLLFHQWELSSSLLKSQISTLNILFYLYLKMVFKVRALVILVRYSVLLDLSHIYAVTAKSLQLCPTLGDPIEGRTPGSASLEFSRQEHWSGLPFPSPMHESEKWKWSRSIRSDSSWPHGLQSIRLLRPWYFPGKSTGVGCCCLLLTHIHMLLIFVRFSINLTYDDLILEPARRT